MRKWGNREGREKSCLQWQCYPHFFLKILFKCFLLLKIVFFYFFGHTVRHAGSQPLVHQFPFMLTLLRASWRSYVCKRLRLTPTGYARRPVCLSTSSRTRPGGALRGFNSHSPSTCQRAEGSLLQRSGPAWASSFLISLPRFLTGLFPRRRFLSLVALRSLSRQKRQRAPLRGSCSWKLRGCFLLCACG